MKKLIALLIALMINTITGRSILGFWEVKEVKVGTEIKTPVAKWIKVNEDGNYQSGMVGCKILKVSGVMTFRNGVYTNPRISKINKPSKSQFDHGWKVAA